MNRIATNIPVYLLLLLMVAGVIFWWKANFPGQIQDIFRGKDLAAAEFTVTNQSGTKNKNTSGNRLRTYQTLYWSQFS